MRTLTYSEPEEHLEPFQASMISVFFRTLCNSGIFSTLLHRKPEHILKLNYIQKPVKYIRWSILFRTLLNYEIFKPLIHLKPQHIQNSRTQNTELKILWISSLQQILFRTLSDMYDESFSTELCVTLAYSEVEAYF